MYGLIAAAVPGIAIAGIVAVVVIAVLVLLAWMMYKVAEPDEALIVSGFRAGPEKGETSELGFKIITGKGVFVIPRLQTVRRLSLAMRKADPVVKCVTRQGIPVHVRGVVVYKIGDSYGEIANAARRFLAREDEMAPNVEEVFAGHLRQIVGAMTVEDIIGSRDTLATETRNSSARDMEKLGLVIDTLQIQEVDDPTGYIENLAKPHQAAVEATARIEAAGRNREAVEKEQEAAALAAKAMSDSQIEQAKVAALANSERAKAEQAGPLAQAEARKAVVVQETQVAELEASREQQRLQTSMVKPAEAQRDAVIAAAEAEGRQVEIAAAAEAKRRTIEADAEAQATQLIAFAKAKATQQTGLADAAANQARLLAEAEGTKAKLLAEAEGTKQKLLAEAEGIEKRAAALEHNQEAVIASSIAERMPEIVRAAAEAYRNVQQLVVLDGMEGIGDGIGQVIGSALAAVPLVRNYMTPNGHTNGRNTEGSDRVEEVLATSREG